jgi:hypothetical protein
MASAGWSTSTDAWSANSAPEGRRATGDGVVRCSRDLDRSGIREILNQVVTAEKQAQANLIRRREETVATRNLLNTAKLMEDSPIVIRLKGLEALEKIAGKVEKICVYGGLEGLLERTIKLT